MKKSFYFHAYDTKGNCHEIEIHAKAEWEAYSKANALATSNGWRLIERSDASDE